jgi:hypothetical protein
MEINMSVQITLDLVKKFCLSNSGNEYEWHHNGVHYRWNLGRDAEDGRDVNGVVRKKTATDSNGNDIWVLAGSVKISPQGKILRFTGLGKKIQKSFILQPIIISHSLETA